MKTPKLISDPRILAIPIILIVGITSFYLGHVLSSTPNTVVSPGGLIQPVSFIIWNSAGTYQAKDYTGKPNIASSTDIGSLTNTVLSLCPTVVNPQSGRTVPICSILYRNGVYNGTSTILLYDDWFVTLTGEQPSPMSLQNAKTIYTSLIDIESSTGVIQLLKNGAQADGGGTITIENLGLRTKTIISSPSGGGTVGSVVQMGTNINNIGYSRLFLSHIGVKDDSTQNTCFMLYSNLADDLTATEDLFCSGTTYHSLVYINAWDYVGKSSIQISAAATGSAQVDSYAFAAIAQGSFSLDSLTLAGTYNGIFEIAGNGSPTICSTTGCTAYFSFVNFGAFAHLNTYAAPSTGYRVFVTAPTIIRQYTKTGGTVTDDMFNDSRSTPGIFYNLEVLHSTILGISQQLPFPFGGYGINSGNTNYAIGPLYDGQAGPTSGRQFTEEGLPLYNLTISGGSGVVINIKDPGGNCLVCGASTVTNARLEIGDTLTITFTGVPSVKAYVEVV